MDREWITQQFRELTKTTLPIFIVTDDDDTIVVIGERVYIHIEDDIFVSDADIIQLTR